MTSISLVFGFLFRMEQWNKIVLKVAWFSVFWISGVYFWWNSGTKQFSSWFGSLSHAFQVCIFWWNNGTKQFSSWFGSLSYDFQVSIFYGTVERNGFQAGLVLGLMNLRFLLIFDGTVERNSYQACLVLKLLIQASYFDGTVELNSFEACLVLWLLI